MIQIRQPKNDLETRRFSAPLAHICGLPIADTHKVDRFFGAPAGSTSARAICHQFGSIAGFTRVYGYYSAICTFGPACFRMDHFPGIRKDNWYLRPPLL